MEIDNTAIALKVLLATAKTQPDKAPALWQAARILLNAPSASEIKAEIEPVKNKVAQTEEEKLKAFPALKAEFDYVDESGLCSHRTVWIMAFVDGRDVKRNGHLPVADRYGYLLTGYCTLRKQIRSFRSSRIRNLRTFMEGAPLEANRQWWPQAQPLAS